jgi:hypothetical protein
MTKSHPSSVYFKVNWPQRLENSKTWVIPSSSFHAPEPKPSSNYTTLSTPEVQKSTNLKSEPWFFHSGLGIFRAHNQPKVYEFYSLLFPYIRLDRTGRRINLVSYGK